MSEEILYIDDGELVYYINENEFVTCNEIPIPMLEGIKHLQQKVDRLNNIINELEKYIHNELVLDFYNDDMPCELIINKMEKMIKELKENNK